LMVVSCALMPERLCTDVLNAETAPFTDAKPEVTFLPRFEMLVVSPATLAASALRALVLAIWLLTVNEPRPQPMKLPADVVCLATTCNR